MLVCSAKSWWREQAADRLRVLRRSPRRSAPGKRRRGRRAAMARSDRARPGLRKTVAGRRRVSAGKEAGGRGRDRAQARLGVLPVAGDDLADGKAVLGVGDRRREQLGPRPGAEPLAKLVPAVDAAGHRPAQRPVDGDRRQPLGLEQLDRRGRRRAAAGVEAVELLGLGVPDDGEQVAADAARHRLDHAEHGVGRDGGIDGVAALLQHADRGRGRQRLAGRGHALPGHHGRARLVQRPGRPVVPLRPGATRLRQASQARHARTINNAPTRIRPMSHDPAPPSFTIDVNRIFDLALRGQSVDRVAERQGRLRPGPRDGQRRGGVGPGGGLVERSPLGQRDGQGTVERIAGADRIDRLDPGRGDRPQGPSAATTRQPRDPSVMTTHAGPHREQAKAARPPIGLDGRVRRHPGQCQGLDAVRCDHLDDREQLADSRLGERRGGGRVQDRAHPRVDAAPHRADRRLRRGSPGRPAARRPCGTANRAAGRCRRA